MPVTQGVDVYSYCSLPGGEITFSIGDETFQSGRSQDSHVHHFEVPTLPFQGGDLKWVVHGGAKDESRTVAIESVTGSMSGQYLDPLDTHVILGENYCICYGYL